MSKSIPPVPAGWNKTIADLCAEAERGERLFVGSPEIDWARDYEMSLIPAEMRFPQQGDVYEALDDMTVHYMTAWAAPFTGGGEGLLKKGDRIVVDYEPHDSRPISTYASAVDYKTVEERMVPASERNASRYGGFYFSFSTVDLNQKFRLVYQDDSHS
ncbi:MAG: hypothetical protein VKK07_10585 [Merismopediaceae bacterium]|nr:hypothetical protein [Merismopediaceae bacterium]